MYKMRNIQFIFDALLSFNPITNVSRHQKPWNPPPTAVNCFLPPDKTFFEGRGLLQSYKLKGRESELKSLEELVGKCQGTDGGAVAITGIGGIG